MGECSRSHVFTWVSQFAAAHSLGGPGRGLGPRTLALSPGPGVGLCSLGYGQRWALSTGLERWVLSSHVGHWPWAGHGPMLKAQGSAPKPQGPRLGAQGSEPKAQGPRLRAQGSGPKSQDLKLRAQGSGPEAQGPRLRAQCSGPKAQGPMLRTQGIVAILASVLDQFRINESFNIQEFSTNKLAGIWLVQDRKSV